MVAADTKPYLTLDPRGLLADASSMWQPDFAMGTVTHQNLGFLWPVGPFFAVGDLLGLSGWVVQRLWLGSILLDHHGLTQSTASLRRALTRADEALALVAETTPQWLDTASVAAQAHLMLFQRTRLDTHLDESIHLSRRVIAGRGRAGALNAAGDTVASPVRASSGPSTRIEARILRTRS